MTFAIVGHNPAMQELAVMPKDGRGDAAGRGEYRTSEVAVFAVKEPRGRRSEREGSTALAHAGSEALAAAPAYGDG